MEENNLVQLQDFISACNDFADGKFILADIKISKILGREFLFTAKNSIYINIFTETCSNLKPIMGKMLRTVGIICLKRRKAASPIEKNYRKCYYISVRSYLYVERIANNKILFFK